MDETLTDAPDAARPFEGCAQVRTADHTTRYVRLGAGQPVVVVDATSNASGLWPGLADRLAEGRRVIIPEVPGGNDSRFAPWLRGFIDGMGIPPMVLLAMGSLCVPSLEFALLEPERVSRLVLIPSGSADETGLAGAVTSTSSAATVLVLVVRRDLAAQQAISLIERFLRGETP